MILEILFLNINIRVSEWLVVNIMFCSNMKDYQNTLIPILCLGVMLIGALFSRIYGKGSIQRKKATVVFVCGSAVLLGNWLMQEPEVILDLRRNIGWIFLGILITFIKLFRKY